MPETLTQPLPSESKSFREQPRLLGSETDTNDLQVRIDARAWRFFLPAVVLLLICLNTNSAVSITRWLRGFLGQLSRFRYLSRVRVVGVDLSI